MLSSSEMWVVTETTGSTTEFLKFWNYWNDYQQTLREVILRLEGRKEESFFSILHLSSVQERENQPPELFCKKRCSENFHNIHRKTTVLGSLFIKLQACNFIKKWTPTQIFQCKYCETLKNTYFDNHLRTAVSRKTKNCLG